MPKKSSYCWLPKRLAIYNEHGLFFVGWVWREETELTYNINHGWIAILDPIKHVRKVVKNTNQKNPLRKGSMVKLPLDILNRTGTIKELTYQGNYCKVESNGELFIVSKDDIYSVF